MFAGRLMSPLLSAPKHQCGVVACRHACIHAPNLQKSGESKIAYQSTHQGGVIACKRAAKLKGAGNGSNCMS